MILIFFLTEKQNLWSELCCYCWRVITVPHPVDVRSQDESSVKCFPEWTSEISRAELHHSYKITREISKILGSESLRLLGLVNWKTVKTTHTVSLWFWLLGSYKEGYPWANRTDLPRQHSVTSSKALCIPVSIRNNWWGSLTFITCSVGELALFVFCSFTNQIGLSLGIRLSVVKRARGLDFF